MSQSGGFAGVKRVTEQVVAPGSPGHVAALGLLADAPTLAGGGARRHPGHPDGRAYDVAVVGPGGELLRATFGDPLPAGVAALLDAIR